MTATWTDRSRVSRNVSYVPGVDHLRGMAALLMVLYHGYQQLSGRVFVRASNPFEAVLLAVSYTHLTLPTKRIV